MNKTCSLLHLQDKHEEKDGDVLLLLLLHLPSCLNSPLINVSSDALPACLLLFFQPQNMKRDFCRFFRKNVLRECNFQAEFTSCLLFQWKRDWLEKQSRPCQNSNWIQFWPNRTACLNAEWYLVNRDQNGWIEIEIWSERQRKVCIGAIH